MEDNNTNTALQAIAKALNEGINERTAMIIIITAVIIFIITFTVVIKLRSRKKIRDSAEASFQKLIRKHNLTILELDLIEELALSMKKSEDKYNLLISKSRFRQAEHKLNEISEANKQLIEGLKLKLGYTVPDDEPGIISTASFTQGQPAKINFGDEELNAEIYSVADANITVKCPAQPTPITTDDEISLITAEDGAFRLFKLYPDKIKGELFSAPHTEASVIEKLNLHLDSVIEIKLPDEEKAEEINAKIVMLSERGAFIHDKKNRLQPLESIRIFLNNDRKKSFPVEATVAKISEEKKLVSIRFTN